MVGSLTLLWALLSGFCLYASLLHLQVGLRRPADYLHVVFGLLALVAALANFGNTQLATAQTADQYQRAIWFSSIIFTLLYGLVPWFVTLYANEANRYAAIFVSLLYVVVLIGNFWHPYSMLQSAPPQLTTVSYPWGETITISSTPFAPWVRALWTSHLFLIAYLVYACVGLFKRGPRMRAWWLLAAAAPFAIALTLNLLVYFGALQIPYTAAYAFVSMVMVMSVALTRELRNSSRRMQVVLDNVPASVYLKKASGRYQFINRQFEQLYGFDSQSVIGKTDADLFDAERAAQQSKADKEVLNTGRSLETEQEVTLKGQRRTYSSIQFPLRNDNGTAYAVCGITTDVTERKRAADSLRELAVTLERRVARRTNELSHLNRELEAFAYSVSHDLRAPLTAVNGFAELLLREHGSRLDQNGTRYVNRIRDGSLRMAALIQDLLGLSRVTQATLERVSTDLAPICEVALKTLREAEPTRTVTATIAPSLLANGDPKFLSLALNNLLANAWKYSAKTADARIEVGSVEQDGEIVYFVRDNGAGFNPEYAGRLFRPFVRLHSENEFPGTGIGLATVARIIAKHGGRIWAEGKPGAGATFYFTLPLGEEELATATTTYIESLST